MDINERIERLFEAFNSLPDEEASLKEIDPNIYDRQSYEKGIEVTNAANEVFQFVNAIPKERITRFVESLPTFKKIELDRSFEDIIAAMKETAEDIKRSPQPSNVQPRNHSHFELKARKIRESFQVIYNILSPLMAMFASELGHAGHKLIDEMKRQIEVLKEQRRDAEVISASIRNLDHLDHVIKSHRWHMYAWLVIFVAASVAALVYLSDLFQLEGETFPEMSVSQTIGDLTLKIATGFLIFKGLGKLVVASIAVGFCIVSSRNYQSHAHNFIVNQHRKASVLNFLQMYNNIASNDHKPELVKHAMESIFTHNNTGFLTKQNADYQTLNPIINAVAKRVS